MPREETRPFTDQKQRLQEHAVAFTPAHRRTHFSVKEIEHLLIGALLVAGVGVSSVAFQFFEDYVLQASVGLITAASFFIHEMAHKIYAQREGFWAEFRLTLMGSILTLISVLPTFFKIISPGAVMIGGVPDLKKLGKTSIVGPATNIVLSSAFLASAFVAPEYGFVLLMGATFNAWIAVFNLIPLGMLDGFKIFAWNKKAWIFSFGISLILTMGSYRLVYY
jgi:Zn-dependent protease